MLPLMMVLLVFGFLLAGSVMFLACLLIRGARAFALSVALWFAVFGVCMAGLMLVSLLFLLGGTAVKEQLGMSPSSPLYGVSNSWVFTASIFIVSAVGASAASWIHQKLIHRMTYSLFRVYAAVVCGGIGSVFGLAGGVLLGSRGLDFGVAIGGGLIMAWLILGFGYFGWRWARVMRGEAPVNLTWITSDEFKG